MSTTTHEDRTFFDTPGYGRAFREQRHYRQAVRIGDRVEISGQGGWSDELTFPADLSAEIEQAFDNVEKTLAEAGAGWADVYALHSFHVSGPAPIAPEVTDLMVDQLRRRFVGSGPVWTAIGVASLAVPGMRVEIRVSAQVAATA